MDKRGNTSLHKEEEEANDKRSRATLYDVVSCSEARDLHRSTCLLRARWTRSGQSAARVIRARRETSFRPLSELGQVALSSYTKPEARSMQFYSHHARGLRSYPWNVRCVPCRS